MDSKVVRGAPIGTSDITLVRRSTRATGTDTVDESRLLPGLWD